MKQKLLYLALLLTYSCFAQEDWACGTRFKTQEIAILQNLQEQFQSFEQDVLKQENNPVLYLPLRIYIVRQTNATGGLDSMIFVQALDKLNQVYRPTFIQFTIDHLHYINNSNYYRFHKKEEKQLTKAHDFPNAINVYCFDEIASPSGNSWSAYVNWTHRRLFLTEKALLKTEEWAHQMAHLLGLYHTEGIYNKRTQELVDGSNCNTTGDRICDTEAAPYWALDWDESCNYKGSGQDGKGNFYQPNPFNRMSSLQAYPRTEWTAMQCARLYVLAWRLQRLLKEPLLSADFEVSEDYTCNNALQVKFKNKSSEATAWEWDVNGDGKTDYYEKNPVHLYKKAGQYNVYLKIKTKNQVASILKRTCIQVGQKYSMPYYEDFEQFDRNDAAMEWKHGWTTHPNAVTNVYRWTANRGVTSTSKTGPDKDNTLGTEQGHYLFTEATHAEKGAKAVLLSPCIEIRGQQPILEFYTHRFGANIGALHLDIYDGHQWYLDVMPVLKGEKQQSGDVVFERLEVDLTAFKNKSIQLRFRAEHASGYRGDIALDDVRIYDFASPIEAIASCQVSKLLKREGYAIQMHSRIAQSCYLYLRNGLGEEVLTQKLEVQKGANNWQFSMKSLPKGNYSLQLQVGQQSFSKRLNL